MSNEKQTYDTLKNSDWLEVRLSPPECSPRHRNAILEHRSFNELLESAPTWAIPNCYPGVFRGWFDLETGIDANNCVGFLGYPHYDDCGSPLSQYSFHLIL